MQLQLDLTDATHDGTRLARLRAEGQGSLRDHAFQVDIAAPLQPPPLLAEALGWASGSGTQARMALRGGWTPAAGGGRMGSTSPTILRALTSRSTSTSRGWSTVR